ncbi:uncharacterized protein BDCG_16716 [Blastomyces dermatitidis ER-3]|uniref:Uncharacterized protein n=2 Tax=Blastomyces TaxID=229219 RepID=A0A179UD95_BLAGS|nr:uncharacterized protein BDBG_16534 [Blastomyces gilchristii SLH14081]XP_045280376.1 uncharacterized protein BDCG_16716 [Blastomyces dermatitidis ER-3]OAT00649.1 hypothetical protein BDCG_16716 [Blastomyces dermatitidis ER-3]OAT05985.1 hypothetical protein BDBG_16534 [Blastomyces gilchristii SLH14081]
MRKSSHSHTITEHRKSFDVPQALPLVVFLLPHLLLDHTEFVEVPCSLKFWSYPSHPPSYTTPYMSLFESSALRQRGFQKTARTLTYTLPH